ncbi:MAG: DUF86 domain-containing protein [Rhodothermales bacterium]
MRDDRERLFDIQEAIERIEQYAKQGQETFETEELIQVWILHHLQIIGEASRALSDGLKNRYPTLPWSKIVGMRNILVHAYFGIDTDLVWEVVERDLAALKRTVEEMLRSLSP